MHRVGKEPNLSRLQQPDYGIDSPAIVCGQLIASLLAIGFALAKPRLGGIYARWIELAVGVYFLQGALGMIHYSRRGKLKLREALLDQVSWHGDESVLDVGCGKGVLLVGAANRLTTGKAIGVDVWRPRALSDNRCEAVLENAAAERVEHLVEVTHGDARQLPFNDGTFDVALSNFVLHELSSPTDRHRMVKEMCRVLKPGGRLALIDFIFTQECVTTLRDFGCEDAVRFRIGGLGNWVGAVLMLGTFQLCSVTATTPSGSKDLSPQIS